MESGWEVGCRSRSGGRPSHARTRSVSAPDFKLSSNSNLSPVVKLDRNSNDAVGGSTRWTSCMRRCNPNPNPIPNPDPDPNPNPDPNPLDLNP